MASVAQKKQTENMNQKLSLAIKSGKYKLGKCSFIARITYLSLSRVQVSNQSSQIGIIQTHFDLQQLPLNQKNRT